MKNGALPRWSGCVSHANAQPLERWNACQRSSKRKGRVEAGAEREKKHRGQIKEQKTMFGESLL